MEDTAASIFGVIGILFALALTVVVIAAQWRIFEKAGKPGWAAIIPIYSTIVLLEIVGKPVWWIILFLIPFVNLVVAIMVFHQLSLSFGKDVGFTLGLIFLSIIFFPILGFGSAEYLGPGGHSQEVPIADEMV